MKKHLFALLILLSSHLVVTAAHWKVFVYMDAGDGLADMAIKNITDMLRGNMNDDDSVEMLLQLHAYGKSALRYQVTHNALSVIEEVSLTGNPRQDFIDASNWGLHDTQDKHTMLIFWNHGWGIIDPQWNPITKEWETDAAGLGNSCELKRSCPELYREHKHKHKGFMFCDEPRSYLSNQDLVAGLDHISNNLLGGSKLDILAFDTCMGGMLEIAYQVAPFANYLVGNQVCALADGFDYTALVTALSQLPKPRKLAEQMVQIFSAYYTEHDISGKHAHTALDLAYAPLINKQLNALLAELLYIDGIKPCLLKAHNASPRFCLYPMYTDLLYFIKELEKQLKEENLLTDTIYALLTGLYQAGEKFVVARCCGFSNIGKVNGFAIYLPTYSLDTTYIQTAFAQSSLWLDCLHLLAEYH